MNEPTIESQGHFPSEEGNSGRQSEGSRNLGKSTPRKGRGGPRTVEGKARSSKNAQRHGILSPDPTAGGEDPGDFAALLAGMESHFEPVGLYERELVARIADEFWALHRITRATSALIDIRSQRIDPPPWVSFIKLLPNRTSWSEYTFPIDAQIKLENLDRYPDDSLLDESIVTDIVRATGAAGFSMPVFDPGTSTPNSAGFLRRFISMTADANGVEATTVITQAAAVLEHVLELIAGADYKLDQFRIERERRAEREATSHLPDLDVFERLCRYKRAGERAIQGWIALLEDSQRARSGELDPPVRVHISEG